MVIMDVLLLLMSIVGIILHLRHKAEPLGLVLLIISTTTQFALYGSIISAVVAVVWMFLLMNYMTRNSVKDEAS